MSEAEETTWSKSTNDPEANPNMSPNPSSGATDKDGWPRFTEPMSKEEEDYQKHLVRLATHPSQAHRNFKIERPEDISPKDWEPLSVQKQAEIAARLFTELNMTNQPGPEDSIRRAWATPPTKADPISAFSDYQGPKLDHYLDSMIGTKEETRPWEIWDKITHQATTSNPIPLVEGHDLWLIQTRRDGGIMLLMAPLDRLAPYIGGESPCPVLIQQRHNFITITGEAQSLSALRNAPTLAGGAEAVGRLAYFWPDGAKRLAEAQARMRGDNAFDF